MKVVLQLIRRPLKTIFGIILVSLAVAALCVGVGQSIALTHTQNAMDETFATVALVKAEAHSELTTNGLGYPVYPFTYRINEKIVNWTEQIAEEESEIVKGIVSHGLASAYVPELVPDNYTQHRYIQPYQGAFTLGWFGYYLSPQAEGAPYSCAMLEITLEEIGEPSEAPESAILDNYFDIYATEGLRVELTGTIESVVGLQEGFADPTGMTVRLIVPLPDAESWDEVNLQVGERYLVYGMDYYDLDWVLRGYLSERGATFMYGQKGVIDIDEFDPSRFRYLEGEELEEIQKLDSMKTVVAVYKEDRHEIYFPENQANMFRTISLTLDSQSFFEEERDVYTLPTIARFEGTVEGFLASAEGELWRDALNNIAVNNQAFPFIGVEKLIYVTEFAKEAATIVEGRDFTKKELENGAKVCLISKSLADSNGLTVGDVITPQFYNYDKNIPYQNWIEDGYGTTNPSAYFYTSTSALQDAVEYEIVGLYQTDSEWSHYDTAENVHGFTPNTIFAPKTSITSDMDYGVQGVFRTILLQHEATEKFQALATQAGYGELFEYYDQGYTVIKERLFDYQSVSGLAMIVGLAVYGIILILFLILFPASQRKVLYTMRSLGATRVQKIGYVLTDSLGILVPGTVIGLMTGVLLWTRVIRWLMEEAGTLLTLEPDMGIIGALVLMQLLLIVVLVSFLAILLTGEKGFMRRKK